MIRTHNFEPNDEFDFDVSVSSCMLSTDTLKLNSTLGTFSGICPRGNMLHRFLLVSDLNAEGDDWLL